MIEPEEGKYDWAMTDKYVEEATRRGIRVLPVLGAWWQYNPEVKWFADYYPEWAKRKLAFVPVANASEARKGFKTCFPPPPEWSRFVRACVERYKGRVTHWEVLNEPNVTLTPEQYVAFLKATFEAVREADPVAKVVGLCATGDMQGNILAFMKACFALGALQYCDIISFHPYSARLDWSAPVSAESMIDEIRKLMKDNGGDSKDLWNTELYYIGRETPDDANRQHLIKGHEMARRFLIDCAEGLGQSISAPASFMMKNILAPHYAGSPSHLSGVLVPSRFFVIYNTLARHFQGAKLVTKMPLTGRNRLYVFERKEGAVAAAWSYDEPDKASILTLPSASGHVRVLDLMGNPLPAEGKQKEGLTVELTNSPCYLVPDSSLDAAGLIKLLEGAVARGKIPLDLSAQMTYLGESPAVVVQARNTTPEPVEALVAVKVPGGEFKTTSPGKLEIVEASGSRRWILPVESSGAWQKAPVVLQAMVGDRIIERSVELRPRKLAICPPAEGVVNLGDLAPGGGWKNAGVIAVGERERIKEGSPDAWKGRGDCSAEVHATRDADFLYLAVKVTDDARGERRAREWVFDGDAVEVYVDPAPDEQIDNPTYTSRTCQLLLGMPTKNFPGLLKVKSSQSGKELDIEAVKTACSERDDGYDLAIGIPWKAFGAFTPQPGSVIGFDISIDDGDTEKTGRKLQMTWAGEADNFKNRGNFGRLLLK